MARKMYYTEAEACEKLGISSQELEDRIIPDIDIEGAALEAHLAEEPAAVAADDPADDRELVPA